MDTATKRISTGKKINAPADDPARWAASQQGRSIDGHLQAVNSGLESVAISIRGADKAMEAIEEHIDQMIETVKFFPPYPEGDNSEERIRMLRSFNGIRQLIDQLTIPPKDDLGQAIMSDPATNPEVPDSWPVIVNEQGDVKTIGRQEVHTGPTGLNIPEHHRGGHHRERSDRRPSEPAEARRYRGQSRKRQGHPEAAQGRPRQRRGSHRPGEVVQ